MLLVRGGEKDDEYAFFTSHLFDRYRERELRVPFNGQEEGYQGVF